MVAIVIDAWQEGRIDMEKDIRSDDDLLKHEPIDSRFTTLENRIEQIENSLLKLENHKWLYHKKTDPFAMLGFGSKIWWLGEGE